MHSLLVFVLLEFLLDDLEHANAGTSDVLGGADNLHNLQWSSLVCEYSFVPIIWNECVVFPIVSTFVLNYYLSFFFLRYLLSRFSTKKHSPSILFNDELQSAVTACYLLLNSHPTFSPCPSLVLLCESTVMRALVSFDISLIFEPPEPIIAPTWRASTIRRRGNSWTWPRFYQNSGDWIIFLILNEMCDKIALLAKIFQHIFIFLLKSELKTGKVFIKNRNV